MTEASVKPLWDSVSDEKQYISFLFLERIITKNINGCYVHGVDAPRASIFQPDKTK